MTNVVGEVNSEVKRGGVTGRSALYAIASKHGKEAIKTLAYLMKHSNNEGIRMGAAKVLLSKVLPDAEHGNDFEPQKLEIEFVEAEKIINSQ